MNKSISYWLYCLFSYLVIVELLIFPVLYVSEYALGFDFKSAYSLRFFYLSYVFIALIVVLVNGRLFVNPLTLIFLSALMVGMLGSLFLDPLRFSYSAFYSHVFYFVMPMLCVSFGVGFYSFFVGVRDSFVFWVKFLAVYALGITFVFYASRYFGFSPYNSIDIWNSIIAVSYLLPVSGGVFAIALLGVVLSQKRTAIAVSLIVISTYIGIRSRLSIIFLYTLIASLLGALITQTGTGLTRVDATIAAIADGNLQFAFSGRVEEAIQVVRELDSHTMSPLFGLGLGVQYYPWPDLAGSEDYLSHSAHIGFFSYALVVGYPIAGMIFLYIFFCLFQAYKNLRQVSVSAHEAGLVLLFAAFLLASLVGGSMVNNPIFWILLGANIQMARCEEGSE